MSAGLLQSRISLISRKDIRWEGILVQVDRENASVTLRDGEQSRSSFFLFRGGEGVVFCAVLEWVQRRASSMSSFLAAEFDLVEESIPHGRFLLLWNPLERPTPHTRPCGSGRTEDKVVVARVSRC